MFAYLFRGSPRQVFPFASMKIVAVVVHSLYALTSHQMSVQRPSIRVPTNCRSIESQA
jgi:hypothetical protein